MTMQRLGLACAAIVIAISSMIAIRNMHRARPQDPVASGTIVLRIGHWQLEAGMRETFDALARRYEELRPGVRIEQVAVPVAQYPAWLNAHLNGRTAPDLVELGNGLTDIHLARFFLPLSDLMGQPNPHNAGTPLEATRWADTFLDGAAHPPAFNETLMEHFGAPMSMITFRIFYNTDLMKTAVGDVSAPTGYDDLHRTADALRRLTAPNGLPVTPLAGSDITGELFMERLFESVTQRLMAQLDRLGMLRADPISHAVAYLRGEWKLTTPDVRHGFQLMRESAALMESGFLQLKPQDALFRFSQQRAEMPGGYQRFCTCGTAASQGRCRRTRPAGRKKAGTRAGGANLGGGTAALDRIRPARAQSPLLT